MTITTLISTPDASEVIRDRIAEILLTETAAQQVLAANASEDPEKWNLRIFLERANPWSEFLDAQEDDLDTTPLVNVSLDNYNIDSSKSNVVSRQKHTAVFHIDCYGFGVSATDGATGHTPGDEAAALEAQRAIRLVRNILMAAEYTYLGLQGTVWHRMLQSVTIFQPTQEQRAVQHVVGARMTFEVGYNEFSPQIEGSPLEIVSAGFKRAENGELFIPEQVLVEAQFNYT
jgi:hypothetical protein